jgi:mono/diheme cytochrome c family protein
MNGLKTNSKRMCLAFLFGLLSCGGWLLAHGDGDSNNKKKQKQTAISPEQNAAQLAKQGQQTFRYDTFGDESFWGEALQLNQAIEGTALGGVGNGISPKAALALGLKVDVQALPESLVQQLRHDKVDLNDPGVTLQLIKLDSVLGVRGTFNTDGSLQSVGLTCAICHSTVDDSLAPGIGNRLDGWANHDLDPGSIIAAAPNIKPITDLLRIVHPTITDDQVRAVLRTWGPGKFDAELLLDGKAARPDGGPSATLIPNAFGLAGHNLHTWTGGWGTVPYWNAFVAVLELRGIGTFFDQRLDDTNKWPIAATFRFGHTSIDDPDNDLVTSKLPALQVFQLSIPAPKPTPGVDFDADAAGRGDALFSGKANCNSCHREPIWTEPGWNDHSPDEMKIDSFQADRSPDGNYKTMNLAGVFIRERGLFMRPENKGRFYHDGRFQTLMDVVNSYNTRFSLGLTDQEKSDLVEYLKSL